MKINEKLVSVIKWIITQIFTEGWAYAILSLWSYREGLGVLSIILALIFIGVHLGYRHEK